jgi:hypothetical protein
MEQNGAIQVGIQRAEESEEIFFYRVHADRQPQAEGVRFDGELLYRREAAGVPSILWAGGFRNLSVRGRLWVRSAVPIESLVLEDGCCEVLLPSEQAANLEIAAGAGTRLLINGHAAPIGALKIQSTVVTS